MAHVRPTSLATRSAALLMAVLVGGCATTTSPTRNAEIASELRSPRGSLVMPDDSRAQQLFVRGLTQAHVGNHERALELYRDALRLVPGEPAILAATAESQEAVGDETAAIYSAQQARSLAPDNVHYHLQLAELYLSSGQRDEAVQVYQAIRDLFPENLDALYEVARVHAMEGDYEEAIAAYEDLLEEIGDDRDIRNEILHLYVRLGDAAGMERVLTDMIEAQPHDSRLRRMLGEVYLKQGREDDAADQLEAALERNPGDVETLLSLTDLYRELGRIERADALLDQVANLEASSPSQLVAQAAPLYARAEGDADARATAVRMLERALDMDPQNADALVMLGDIRLSEARYTEAGQLLYRALQENPRDPQIWLQAAGAYMQAGDFERSAEIADEALLLFPGSVPLLRISGYALMDTYRNREAAKRFEEAVAIIREDSSDGEAGLSELYSALGLLYDRTKDHEASDGAYEQALQINPDNATVLNNYAYSLAERNVRLSDALEMAQRAVELSPEVASFLDTLGWIHFRRAELDAALEWIGRAADMPQASAAVHEHLGDIHDALGNDEEAVRAWQRALDANPESASLKKKINSR